MKRLLLISFLSILSNNAFAEKPMNFDIVKNNMDSLRIKIENLSNYKKTELSDSISQCINLLDIIIQDADHIILSLESEIETKDSLITYISQQDTSIFFEPIPFVEPIPKILRPAINQIENIINFKNCVDSIEQIINEAKENTYIDLTTSEDKDKVYNKNVNIFNQIYDLYEKITDVGDLFLTKEQWNFFIKQTERFNLFNDILK